MEKIKTSGNLGLSGKEFECFIGDNRDEIAKMNPDLTPEEVDHVYDITRADEFHEKE